MRELLGVPSGQLRLVEHRPQWRACFVAEAARLRAALGSAIVEVEHIGSTAIPGLIAKPILDLAIAVHDFEAAACCVASMEALGYEHRGEAGIARRRYFVLGEPRTHHVHMLELRSEQWRGHLGFRDALLAHPEEAAAYARLKRDLAEAANGDRSAYQDGKDRFIEDLIARSLAALPLQ
jgi:GrpB-like predicted nucleotidyltransferase (UPF0157 family)